jgi:ABC-type antimicrobial peptide transport system permease subunit
MISAIRKAEEEREKEPNREDDSIKNDAIGRIEKLLKKKGIKAEELESSNRNYKEAINNSGETVDEILDVEERIQRDINKKHEKKNENDDDSGHEGHVKGEVKRKKKLGQEINEVQAVVNYLQEEQKKNPSSETQQKLEKAEGRLNHLVSLLNNNNKIPYPYVIGAISLIVAVIGIGFLMYRKTKNRKY